MRPHQWRKTPERKAWGHMVRHCTVPTDKRYAEYGGRGVRVCKRWQGSGGFERFLADVGPRPAGLWLMRVDPYGHFEPGNCRWGTRAEHARSRRADGVTKRSRR